MNRRSFLASVAALFTAPLAALANRWPGWSASQVCGDLGQWSENGYYGMASVVGFVEENMRTADAALRRMLDDDFKTQMEISTPEAFRRQNDALGRLLDRAQESTW